VIDAPVNNIDWIPTLMELAGAPVPSGLDGISFADGLTGGTIPERKLFWHFPHYTNQGGRPSGAVRDGNWLLVELYDEKRTELYDLSTDICEHHDLAGQHPDRVASMKAALDGWRRENDVQYNTPNPGCDDEKYRRLYVDIDVSRFDPVIADEEEWVRICTWRKGMDEVYQKGQE
jgi:arylsulfatase A-like enzyme